jgi:hypothetical protein
MKKVLLTIAVAAISFATNAQTATYSANGFVTGFDGTAAENCGVYELGKTDSYIPSSSFTNTGAAYSNFVVDNGVFTFNVDGSAVGAQPWHKVFIQFNSDCGTPANIDLSDAANHKFKIVLTSSAAVKQFMVMAADVAGVYADNAPIVNKPLVAGQNTFTANAIDFKVFGSEESADKATIMGVGLYFRTSYENTAALADISVDYIAIGDQVVADGVNDNVIVSTKTIANVYNFQGQEVDAAYQGLAIIKYTDGTTEKVVR